MPLVTYSDRPRGAPAATTAWPTCIESDLAKTAGVRFCCPSPLLTTRSLVSALPRPPLPPLCTLMVTSEGSILAAAAPTVPSSLGLWAAGRVLTPIGEVADPDAE